MHGAMASGTSDRYHAMTFLCVAECVCPRDLSSLTLNPDSSLESSKALVSMSLQPGWAIYSDLPLNKKYRASASQVLRRHVTTLPWGHPNLNILHSRIL